MKNDMIWDVRATVKVELAEQRISDNEWAVSLYINEELYDGIGKDVPVAEWDDYVERVGDLLTSRTFDSPDDIPDALIRAGLMDD